MDAMLTDEENRKAPNCQYVALDTFKQFLKNDVNWVNQVKSDDSPMMSFFKSEDIFLKSEKKVLLEQ